MDDLFTTMTSGSGRYGVKIIKSQNAIFIEWFRYRSQQKTRYNYLCKIKTFKSVKLIEISRLTGSIVEC